MKDTIFKLIDNIGLLWVFRNAMRKHLTVLSLHRVSPEQDYFFQPISPALFKELLIYVKKNYFVTTFAELDSLGNKIPHKYPPLILSFDDGYKDFMEYALPLLLQYQLPCNHNLVNACLTNNENIWTQDLNDCFNFFKNQQILEVPLLQQLTGSSYHNSEQNWYKYYNTVFQYLLNQPFSLKKEVTNSLKTHYGIASCPAMMSWHDASELPKCGVEIGSHSYTHNTVHTLSSEQDLEAEIGRSVIELREKLNVPIQIFAAPNGLFSNNSLAYCQKTGLKYCLSVDSHITPLSCLQSDFTVVSRTLLVDEKPAQMRARVAQFHSKIKKINE